MHLYAIFSLRIWMKRKLSFFENELKKKIFNTNKLKINLELELRTIQFSSVQFLGKLYIKSTDFVKHVT